MKTHHEAAANQDNELARSLKEVVVHTDGSRLGNPGPGGYGAILEYHGHRKELTGGFRLTTNNRMELRAVVESLTALREPCRVTVHSDSQYIVEAMTQRWPYRWRSNGWRRRRSQPAVNPDLWAKLLDLCDEHVVVFVWVKAHAGNPRNERCDHLAVAAAHGSDLQTDVGYEASTSGGDTPALDHPC